MNVSLSLTELRSSVKNKKKNLHQLSIQDMKPFKASSSERSLFAIGLAKYTRISRLDSNKKVFCHYLDLCENNDLYLTFQALLYRMKTGCDLRHTWIVIQFPRKIESCIIHWLWKNVLCHVLSKNRTFQRRFWEQSYIKQRDKHWEWKN